MDAPGHRWIGLADRLRESGQPHAGEGQRSRAGNWRAFVAWSNARPPDPAASGGKLAAGRGRRRTRRAFVASSKPGNGGVSEYRTYTTVCGFAPGLASARIYFRA